MELRLGSIILTCLTIIVSLRFLKFESHERASNILNLAFGLILITAQFLESAGIITIGDNDPIIHD